MIGNSAFAGATDDDCIDIGSGLWPEVNNNWRTTAPNREAASTGARSSTHPTTSSARTRLGSLDGFNVQAGATNAVLVRNRWLEGFDDYSFEARRIVDCGGDHVLVVGPEVGTGAMSGAEIRSLNYELLTIRDGLIVRATASSTTKARPSKPPGYRNR